MLISRYDRQLRLWGETGQQCLKSSHILVVDFNYSALLLEVVKNLALTGIGKLSLLVETNNDEHGTFFDDSSLRVLNTEVELNYLDWDKAEFSKASFWKKFTAVIVTSSAINVLKTVTDFWHYNSDGLLPILILAYSIGLYGYIRIFSKETHCVVEVQSENQVPDLRLDVGWPELDKYCMNIDLVSKDNAEIAELPFATILRRAVLDSSSKPIKTELMEYLQHLLVRNGAIVSNPYLNFVEAEKHIHLALRDSRAISENILRLINIIPKNLKKVEDPFNRSFWILIEALRKFLSYHKQLPLAGNIPDMESSTVKYSELKALYQKKAREDMLHLKSLTKHNIESDMIELFSYNVRNIKVVNFSEVLSPEGSIEILDAQKEELAPLLQVLIADQFNLSVKLNEPSHLNYIEKVQATKGKNLYPVTAMIGGMVCQEIIKVLTHKFVPLENAIVYDGLLNKLESLKM
ncbi:HGL005Wp [Eremothecium sinecaudum]|uniref:HGL005Wp n=1 Tax=Eremothecium sinecaudum TaxID=45286 RepID=A0A109V025_9SACH|nr:HGL005Wp [Eremothecium sinecaudum]AMD22335.1 HGL005Wp [Eremothecium sinecaudum]